MKLAAAALAFLALTTPAAAKPGDLDRTFGYGGRIAFAGGEGYSDATGIALDTSGRPLVTGGTFGRRIAGRWVIGPTLARLTRSGRVDFRTPLPDPRNDGTLTESKVVALPGGGALVGATLEHPPGLARIGVWRVRPDGALDTAFGMGGAIELALRDTHLSLAGIGVDGSGRIAIAAMWGPADHPRSMLLRLRAHGELDASVALAGGMIPDALLLERSGRAFVAGHVPGGHGRRARAVVYAAGPRGSVRRLALFSLRSTRAAVADVAAIARGPNGSLLLAGNDGRRRQAPLPDRPWVARLRRGGHVTRTFPAVGGRQIELMTMARDHHGRIVLAGAESTSDDRAVVMRLRASGRRDPRFPLVLLHALGARPGTELCCSQARAVAIDARNRILVAGVSFDASPPREDLGRSYFAVARLKG